MKKHLSSRLLSLLLALSLLASFVVPVRAAGLSWNAVDTAVSADLADRLVQGEAQETVHRDTDLVRVSIVLEEKPTVQAGYSTMDIARNDGAMAYRESLQARQQAVAQSISAQALGGQALDALLARIVKAHHNLHFDSVNYRRIEMEEGSGTGEMEKRPLRIHLLLKAFKFVRRFTLRRFRHLQLAPACNGQPQRSGQRVRLLAISILQFG